MAFKPAHHMHGGMYAVAHEYAVAPSNTIVPGDLVILASGSEADGTKRVATAAAGNPPLGVCIGIQPVTRSGISGPGGTNVQLNTPQIATPAMRVLVCDDPQVVYEADSTGTLTTAMIGQNANISAATYNTSTGYSNHTVNVTTAATTATLQVKIIGIVKRPNNSVGASTKLLVKLNGAQMGEGTGTVGV